MRNIKAIIKYEFLNLYRSFIIIIMLLLFLFGVQQQLWTTRIFGEFRLTLITFLKTFWLPINLIYIPILIVNEIIGASNHEVFEVLNISKRQRFLGKVFTSSIINLIIIIINVGIVVTVAMISKAPFKYSVYLISMYLLNIITGIFCFSSIGLLIGETISKFTYRIFSYIIMLAFFLLANNFYKEPNILTPIMSIDTLPSTFQLFSLDKLTLYHFIFWNLIGVLVMYLLYNIKELRFFKLRKIIILICLIVSIITAFFVGLKYNPQKYYIEKDNINENYDDKSKFNDGFIIESYNMKLNLEDEISNNCDMEIIIKDEKINKLQLNLYNSLKVANIRVNEEDVKYSAKGDILTIFLPQKYNEEDKINVSIKYSGIINTVDMQGKKRFLVNRYSLFLADYFPWYPKSNFMANTKKYELKIENNTGHIYSNLIEINSGTFEGKGKEIFLIKSNVLSKHIYKDIEFIGNMEQVATDQRCEDIINIIKMCNNTGDFKRVILTPQRDKEYLIYNLYDGLIVFGQLDEQSVLDYRR